MSILKKNKKKVFSTVTPVSIGQQSRVKDRKKKTLRVGDVCNLKITALAPNNVGIDEYTYKNENFTSLVFVPNAKIGDTVKAKISEVKTLSSSRVVTGGKAKGGRSSYNKGVSYAFAQLIETKKNGSRENTKPGAEAGDILEVYIEKQTKQTGLGSHPSSVELSNNYKLVIPFIKGLQKENGSSLPFEEPVKVTVTRVKSDYAFGNVVSPKKERDSFNGSLSFSSGKREEREKSLRCKFTAKLPLNLQQYGKYILVKWRDKVLFLSGDPLPSLLRQRKGVRGVDSPNALSKAGELVLGRDKVRIKIKGIDKKNNFLVGKILKLANYSFSLSQKKALVIKSLRSMLSNGMHFGEKAVKCHARMKPYLWTVKKRGGLGGPLDRENTKEQRPFIMGPPRLIRGRHVINLLKTRRCLNKALNTLTKYALKGRTFLFIGTKKPAKKLVERASFFTKNSFYVNTRWLGGMLTNWKTICKSISKIRPILKEKQKVVRDILERRQSIKSRLIKKALLLKTKGKLILTKGRSLLSLLRDKTKRNALAERFFKIANGFSAHASFGTLLKRKQRKLFIKNKELMKRTLLLKREGFIINDKYKQSLAQLTVYTKKLRSYKFLLTLIKEIQQLDGKDKKRTFYTVSYSNFKNIFASAPAEVGKNQPLLIPNPPKEILNLFALIMKNSKGQVGVASRNATFKNAAKSTTVAKPVVCSSLLLSFARQYRSYIKTVIKTLVSAIKILHTQCKNASFQLNTIKTTLQKALELKNQFFSSLQQLKKRLKNERTVIQMVKRELKTLEYQKKFLLFLPRLNYLPTKKQKISSIVNVLLSKIVDPKLKYPIDPIYSNKLSNSSKKLAAARKKKWQRLEKYFGGIANMTKLSLTKRANTVAIIIGQKEEMNAVRECKKLGMKTVTIVDTNCDPSLSNHIIPANDDSRNSIQYILNQFITRIRLAQKIRSRVLKYKKTK